MHFTRDPIIETIISPKDGFKLSVRNPRSSQPEEYIVNALEVVSFGTAFFFRSLEKPKAFLLPISDYEVVEVKEARMVLKNVSLEKPIKIGDNKEAKNGDEENHKNEKTENKKSRKRTSRKKKSSPKTEQKNPVEKEATAENTPEPSDKGGDTIDEDNNASSSVVPIVFPSPPKIIGRKIPVPETEEPAQGNILPEESEKVGSPENTHLETEPEPSQNSSIEEEKKEDQEAS